MIYQIAAMMVEHEFSDIAFVGKYCDRMIADTGDRAWAIVYEWAGDYVDPDLKPDAVLERVDGEWVRRPFHSL